MHLLYLPQLGYTMESGVINLWLKKEGEPFDIGEPLYEVETAKNVVEIEARLPGTLARVVAPTGIELPVGSLLAVVADPGESPTEEEIDQVLREAEGTPAQIHPVTEGPGALVNRDVGEAAPSMVSHGTRDGIPANPAAGARIRALPKARALAAERGIDLASLVGSGKGGSITVEDVERAAAERDDGVGRSGKGKPRVRERRPLTAVHQAMATATLRSWTNVPQFVQQVSVDASGLQRVRARYKERGQRVTLTDLLLQAVVRAVRDVPEANASFVGDAVELYEEVSICVATATDRGLLLPVLRNAHEMSLQEISTRVAALVEKARAGQLTPAESEGATITVSNLGASGVENGFPLINEPHSCLVFTGAVRPTPVAEDGAVVVKPVLGLAIAYDHRVLDGATAARFTMSLKNHLEQVATEGVPS